MTVASVCKAFGIRGRYIDCETIHTGNINSTYRVTFRTQEGDQQYIVQKINAYVFKNPVENMKNIAVVTEHIKKKIEQGTHRTADRFVLQFLTIPTGENYYMGREGNVWRAYRFIDDSVTYDAPPNLTVLQNAGAAFGLFQRDLMDFDVNRLYNIIPDFHNTPRRLDTLEAHLREDALGRVEEVRELAEDILASRPKVEELFRLVESGEIPYRVTHNDTKCNNVLFDREDGQALAVIDLDTVMPGLIMYDFGDAVRFAANKAAEDEPDTTLVGLDLERYTAFTQGFVGALGENITQPELAHMALGAYCITAELAARFLDDFITGDKYFATRYPGHNVDRAACQITLAKDMAEKLPEMQRIVDQVYANRA